jgi:hypothetical protein
MKEQLAASESWFRIFVNAEPDEPLSHGRPDFHLRDVPPLAACEGRLDLATVLKAQDKSAEAIAELVRVTTDCADSEALVHRAQEQLHSLGNTTAPLLSAPESREVSPREP